MPQQDQPNDQPNDGTTGDGGDRLRVLVHGAGGIGLYAAARLAGAGHDVTLKGRASTVAALVDGDHDGGHDGGRGELRVLRDGAVTAVAGVRVTDRVPTGEPFDLVVVATKSWQVADAARELVPAVGPGTRVLTTQNGVDAPDRLAAHLPAEAVLAGTVVVIAQRVGPGEVEVVGGEATLTVGAPGRGTPDDADRRVLAALEGARVGARWTDDVASALWKKLALVASYGGVGALAGATVGETRSTPETRDLVERAMREVLAVGNAEGAHLGDADLSDILRTYESGFAPGTTTSLQRDLAAGVPSELADQSGAVVAHAIAAGVDAPVHHAIYASQLPRENAARRATAGSS
ncbi:MULTISPECIES: ketopantoate reductase family protein [unclassified Isoptericola]|uniref:ketopantoate reductase family protein n=1 Tax=unclassified Isoptericola TaxID=2623355 RepID=UPI00365B7567